MSLAKRYEVEVTAGKDLVDVIKRAVSVAPKKSSAPILECVLFHVSRGFVDVSATDSEVWYTESVPVDAECGVVGGFDVLIHKSALKGIKKGVKLGFTETGVLIGGVFNKMYADPAEYAKYAEFPALDTVDGSYRYQVDSRYFADFLAAAEFASTSEVRPVLTAVCHREGYITATDGFKLLRVFLPEPFEADFLVPASAGKLLAKVFADSAAQLIVTDTRAFYSAPNKYVGVRRIDGRYPDITRIIPANTKASGKIEGLENWVALLESAKTVAKSRDNCQVDLTVEEGDMVVFKARSADAEFEEMLAFPMQGEGLDISFNTKDLLAGVKSVGEGGTIGFNGPKQPALLKNKGGRREAVLAPILLK